MLVFVDAPPVHVGELAVFLMQADVALIAVQADLACVECLDHGTPRFYGMAAVGEVAIGYIRRDVREIRIDFLRVQVEKGERSDTGCVGYPSAYGEGNQFCDGRRVPTLPGCGTHLITRMPSPGSRALSKLDFPTPDGPMRAEVLSLSRSRNRSIP